MWNGCRGNLIIHLLHIPENHGTIIIHEPFPLLIDRTREVDGLGRSPWSRRGDIPKAMTNLRRHKRSTQRELGRSPVAELLNVMPVVVSVVVILHGCKN
jgi:hypothetical protein